MQSKMIFLKLKRFLLKQIQCTRTTGLVGRKLKFIRSLFPRFKSVTDRRPGSSPRTRRERCEEANIRAVSACQRSGRGPVDTRPVQGNLAVAGTRQAVAGTRQDFAGKLRAVASGMTSRPET